MYFVRRIELVEAMVVRLGNAVFVQFVEYICPNCKQYLSNAVVLPVDHNYLVVLRIEIASSHEKSCVLNRGDFYYMLQWQISFLNRAREEE